MKIANLTLFGLFAVVAVTVLAQTQGPVKVPRLEFRTIPIEGVNSPDHKVTPYRIFDTVIVTVWDPIACGQKPTDPAFIIEGNKVLLSYKLTAAAPNAKACTLVSEFDLMDAPNRELEVGFAGGPEPYVIAQMRKCPYYTPSSADIWECLTPATK
jgi:hypothetical protein